MLAIVAPGQGAQTPGFLEPWLELPAFAARLSAWSQVAGIDLVELGTRGDADQIKDTAVAQPLLVAAGLGTLGELLGTAKDEDPTAPGAGLLAGHSVGELTATAAAGVLSAEAAMAFVAARGRGMAEASAVTPTGMTAVLGGDRDAVLAKLAQHGLTPANDNGAGQIVAAGTMEQLAALAEDGPEKARLIPLSVAGAFHTTHMAPAVEQLATLAATLTPADPVTTLLSNADGAAVSTGQEVLDRLVRQVSNPVRWDLCMESMLSGGVTGIIELLPGGTLVGLAKRSMRGVASIAVKTPDDLDAARELLRSSRMSPEGHPALDRRRPRRLSALAATDRPASSPTTRSASTSTPPTSGSAPGPVSPPGASRCRRRRSRTCRSLPVARRSPQPASPRSRSAPSWWPPAR